MNVNYPMEEKVEEEMNATDGTRRTHQNSPSSSTVMPRFPRSMSPTLDHSSELTNEQMKINVLKHRTFLDGQ